uniref:Annexin n=1 Tax=Arcella intermedia TaxID=1963864 RepID=A0A6B2LC55_9EUKA
MLLITPAWIVKKDALREAVDGLGTRDAMLIAILSQASNAELLEFGKDAKLRQNVVSDVSGEYKKVVEQLLQGTRPEWGAIAPEAAADLAHRFYKAGEGKIGTDESSYISIILNNSREALYQVNHVYKEKHKHDLKTAIKKETSGNFKRILCALLTPRHEFFADKLRKAMKGAGTNERMLNFVFSTLDRGEIAAVAQVYKEKFKVSLKDDIKGDTSGCYQELLLKLVD